MLAGLATLAAFSALPAGAQQPQVPAPSAEAPATPAPDKQKAVQALRFRHVDPVVETQLPDLAGKQVVLLADKDFAPWSFSAADGSQRGIAVDLAMAACKRLKADCTLKAVPFETLALSLQARQGDVVITGINVTPAMAGQVLLTRPWYRSMAQFVVRRASNIDAADTRSIAGRRLGYVKGTAHAAFVEKHFFRAALTPFENFDAMMNALNDGTVDLVFGDALPLSFWLQGAAGESCCKPLAAPFVQQGGFTRGMSFLVRPQDQALRDAFDAALDALQEDNSTGKILASYLPSADW